VESNFNIRVAEPVDAAAIAEILYVSFVEFRPLYTQAGFAATAVSPHQILVRMKEGPVWVACRDSVLIGTVAALQKSGSVYIRGMAVLPSGRGSGIGAALLRQVEEWSITQQCGRLVLSTTPFLHAAIRLYENTGFQRTRQGPHDLFGTPLLMMEKVCVSPLR
jgi:GNAT superfamily N-acetyltransferase